MNDSYNELPLSEKLSPEDGKLLQKLGQQVIVWLMDCDRDLLKRPQLLEKLLDEVVSGNSMTVRDKVTSYFDGHGITIVYVLQESHLVMNTWPEYGAANIDFFSCRQIAPEDLIGALQRTLRAKRLYYNNIT